MMPLGTLRRFVMNLLSPLESRLSSLVDRVTIAAVDDEKKSQVVTLTSEDGEDGDEVERPQSYGVSFRPPAGAEALVVSIGSSAYRIALAVQDRDSRPAENVEEGEGGLYLLGEYKVFLSADGTISLGAKEADDFAALASMVETELDRIHDAIKNAVPGSMDGGAALQTTMVAGLGVRGSVGSSVVKVQS